MKFTGSGGTVIEAGSLAAAQAGGGLDPLVFTTTTEETIPNPGTPTAPVATPNAAAGNPNGSYEYVITFVTDAGETRQSVDSNVVTVSSKKIDLNTIPLGGPGTLSRNIYRQKDGVGAYKFVANIPNNTTTNYLDNIADGSVGPATPPEVSTAESILSAAVATAPGTAYNVQPGTVIILTAGITGVTAVTNPEAFEGGTNQESIEEYRLRLMEYLRDPRDGSAADLTFWAQQIEGVDSATVFPNDFLGTHLNGHVTVRIVGPGGTIPDSTVVANVQTYLELQDVANIIVHVATFDPLTLPVHVTITPADGFILDDVELDVKEAVVQYIATVPIGGTAYTSGVIDAVFGLPGIKDVTTTLTNTASTPTTKLITGLDDVFVTAIP